MMRAFRGKWRGGNRVGCSVSLGSFYAAGWRGLETGDGGEAIFEWKGEVARGLYRSLKHRMCKLTAPTLYSDTKEK